MIEYNKKIKISPSLTCGYQTFCDSKHPLKCGSGWVYYHRHVASIKIGRWLTKKDHVHHKDGNKENNLPENLEVLTHQEHSKLHWPQKLSRLIVCPVCGSVKQNKQSKYKIYCSGYCRNLAIGYQTEKPDQKTKIIWPTKDEMEKFLSELSMVKIGKKLGVSDVAVKKFCRKNDISI